MTPRVVVRVVVLAMGATLGFATGCDTAHSSSGAGEHDAVSDGAAPSDATTGAANTCVEQGPYYKCWPHVADADIADFTLGQCFTPAPFSCPNGGTCGVATERPDAYASGVQGNTGGSSGPPLCFPSSCEGFWYTITTADGGGAGCPAGQVCCHYESP